MNPPVELLGLFWLSFSSDSGGGGGDFEIKPNRRRIYEIPNKNRIGITQRIIKKIKRKTGPGSELSMASLHLMKSIATSYLSHRNLRNFFRNEGYLYIKV